MKIKIFMATAIVAAFGLSSCGGEDAKLAGELTGTWKGATTQMTKGKKDKPDKDDRHNDGNRNKPDRMDMDEMNCTPTFTFVRSDGTNGGTIDISADYTITKGVESIAMTTPVNATVTGNFNASGTWTVKDGDEVILNLDPSKTVVNVDTTSVTLAYARLTDAPQDSLNSLKGRIVSNIPDVVKPMIAAKVQKMRKLDDIKITGNTMILEAGHNKIPFTKQ
jgi:lipoprotein